MADVRASDQDCKDGAALRLLREALPPWLTLELSLVHGSHFAGDTFSGARVIVRDMRSGHSGSIRGFDAATIARAADMARRERWEDVTDG